MQGWLSNAEQQALLQNLGENSTTRRLFREGIRREPSEYRDMVVGDSYASSASIRAMLNIDRWLKGEIPSNSKVGRMEVYCVMDINILCELKYEDLYEFALIADAENEEVGQSEGFSPTLVWIFRHNGHAIINYYTLRTNEIDCTALRKDQLRRKPNCLSGYSYKLKFDLPGFVFRTQPILLPPKPFYWDNIISKIRSYIRPALTEKGYMVQNYEQFSPILQLSTNVWWNS